MYIRNTNVGKLCSIRSIFCVLFLGRYTSPLQFWAIKEIKSTDLKLSTCGTLHTLMSSANMTYYYEAILMQILSVLSIFLNQMSPTKSMLHWSSEGRYIPPSTTRRRYNSNLLWALLPNSNKLNAEHSIWRNAFSSWLEIINDIDLFGRFKYCFSLNRSWQYSNNSIRKSE